MILRKYQGVICALALAGALAWRAFPVHADDDQSNVRKVFVIAMENHNWTQPSSVTSPEQISGNPAAPFINGLVNGSSGISDQVAYATNYINAGINLGLHVHPSEPNYVWASSFLRTMQEIFRVDPSNGYQWLGDAANANGLSDLFKPESIE